MDKLLALLKSLEVERFYGDVLIKLEAGKVVIIRRTESIKP